MVKVREEIPVFNKPPQPDAPSKNFSQTFTNHTIDISTWLERVCETLSVDCLPELKKACDLVAKACKDHDSNCCSSDIEEKYRANALENGIWVADILSYLVNDENVLVSAMLFRATRQGLIDKKALEENFSADVVKLTLDTLAMGRLSEMIEKNKRLEDHFINNQKDHLAGIYKMLISVTNDVRVVLVKLAERTFALRQLENASHDRQQRVAREIMSIYAPLAHRLGIAQLKWELEDLAFRYLAPARYKEIAKLLAEKRMQREDYIARMQAKLKNALDEEGIDAEISGRVKHIYSIYKKMKQKQLSFDQLYDIRALRVLVQKKSQCYHILGIAHELWHHIPEQFDDYITNPKANGYRSLHTAVIAENKSLEIQIRTHDMHYEAELGVCAHVNYKEGTQSRPDAIFTSKLNSLRQVLASYQDKQDIETDEDDKPLHEWSELERIYVFTRDGDIQELPKGATVLDFAYYVHTQIGNMCAGARVNQRFVPLTYILKTGEQIEIVTRKGREPKRDWLVQSLGYIKTSRARTKLKHWFNQQDRGKNIQIGREMLNKELTRLGLHPNSVDLNKYLDVLKINSSEDILVSLVNGELQLESLFKHISAELQLEPDISENQLMPSVHPRATGSLDAYKINVDGIDNIDIHLAHCCYPLHGEPIMGYITKQNGVSIHHKDCIEYARLLHNDPDRGISATWYTQNQANQRVQIILEAYDRRGLLKDMTQVIDNEKVNIVKINTLSQDNGSAYMTIDIEVTGLNQLSRLLAKLEQQPGVISVRRQQHG